MFPSGAKGRVCQYTSQVTVRGSFSKLLFDTIRLQNIQVERILSVGPIKRWDVLPCYERPPPYGTETIKASYHEESTTFVDELPKAGRLGRRFVVLRVVALFFKVQKENPISFLPKYYNASITLLSTSSHK
jgi:hypothetical protein